MLDLESEVNQRPGFNPHWIFFCFHVVKPLMPILALLPILCVCEKPNCVTLRIMGREFSEYEIFMAAFGDLLLLNLFLH